jgi:hypothetical protein
MVRVLRINEQPHLVGGSYSEPTRHTHTHAQERAIGDGNNANA